MKKDWTDIIAEELRKAEEPLPEDSWAAVQQKYAAHKRKGRRALISWIGAGLSAAAVILLGMILSPDEEVIVPGTQAIHSPDRLAVDRTEKMIPEDEERQVRSGTAASICTDAPTDTDAPVRNDSVEERHSEAKLDNEKEGEPVRNKEKEEAAEEDNRETITTEKSETTPSPVFDLQPLIDQDPVFEFEDENNRFNASISVSGTGAFAGASTGLGKFEDYPGPSFPDDPESPGLPLDSTGILPAGCRDVIWKRHNVPVSFAVSGRFHFTRTFSLNASLQYSMYKSAFNYHMNDTETRYQYAHYLGLGLRADFNLISRKHFAMYAGIGAQTDRCFYTVYDKERISVSRQSWLWSINVVLGFEYRINSLLGIYLEPVFTANFNEPDLTTYRTGKTLMFSGCIGLRFNL